MYKYRYERDRHHDFYVINPFSSNLSLRSLAQREQMGKLGKGVVEKAEIESPTRETEIQMGGVEDSGGGNLS